MPKARWHRLGAALSAFVVTAMVMPIAQTSAATDPGDRVTGPPPLPTEPDVDGSNVRAEAVSGIVTAARAVKAASAVVWPSAASAVVGVPASRDDQPVKAAGLPVHVSAAESVAGFDSPARVRVEMLDRSAAERAGVSGVLLRLTRADGKTAAGRVMLSVDYSQFQHAFGGDWAARLSLALVDGERLTPVDSTNNIDDGQLWAEVSLDGASMFALTAEASGSTGDYEATSLSSAGSWQVAANSGTFAWSYPLALPATPGGLIPELGLSYSSASVDGKSAATNNQPTWAGEGWDLWPGFIERGYRSCSADGGPATGDLCWAGDNATLSLNGQSIELIRDTHDADGDGNRSEYRLRNDDGTRVEQLFGSGNGDDNGEYWKVTTTDGVQYIFGRTADSVWTVPVFGNQQGEPCRSGSFATSKCDQGWRWNLNQVIDTHQNTITYVYGEETNSYAMNMGAATASYTRGGYLLRAEYGTQVGGSGFAPVRVTFDVAERCIPGSACAQTGADYPDVPFDLQCQGGSCAPKYSPTFWSTKRLSTIIAEVHGATGYVPVDSWTLRHIFPNPGDSTSASLWLGGITHTGHGSGNTVSMPEVVFDGDPYENRVDSAPDGRPPMIKFRMGRIHNESGGTTIVEYAPKNCTPNALPQAGNNPLRCFPVHWKPEPGEPVTEFFHKYVVAEVSNDDRVGANPTMITRYEYVGDAAWRFNDHPLTLAERRTWSQWRGYSKVIVRTGDPADTANPRSAVQYLYVRGMNGDPLPGSGTRSVSVTDSQGTAIPDDNELAGFLREQITFNGDTTDAIVSSVIGTPWRSEPTANQAGRKSFIIGIGSEQSRTALSGGRWRTTRVDSTFNAEGMVTRVDDLGDTSTPTDDRCTRMTYARNEQSWLLTPPARVETVGVACGGTASYPADLVSDVRTFYDGSDTLGAPPSAGDATRVEHVKQYAGQTPVYVATARSQFDQYGRVQALTDARGNTTTTAYTDTNGLTTKIVVTSPDPDGSGSLTKHTSTTELNPARGVPTKTTDANGRATTLSYDPLGRVSKVQLPGASALLPNLKFGYEVRPNGPSWVRTQRLNANNSYATSYALFDGFLRQRQTQSPAHGGGRVVADTIYDSRGFVAKVNGAYWDADAAPGTTLFDVRADQVPG